MYMCSYAAVSVFLSARRHGAKVAVDILDSKTKIVAGSNDPFDGEVAMCTHDRRYKIFERIKFPIDTRTGYFTIFVTNNYHNNIHVLPI